MSASSATIRREFHECINTTDYPSIFQYRDKVEYLSACQGLSWIRTTKNSCEEFYIWNSISKECKKIPMTQEVNYYKLGGYGFGHDYKTDNYKLVMVTDNWDSKCSDVDVYTLGSNSWKRIQSIPYSLSEIDCYFEGVSFKGSLHWLAHTFDENQKCNELVRFDIINERFQNVALPSLPKESSEKSKFNIKVGEFGGCMCVVFQVFNLRVDVSMMQEYGVRDSCQKEDMIIDPSGKQPNRNIIDDLNVKFHKSKKERELVKLGWKDEPINDKLDRGHKNDVEEISCRVLGICFLLTRILS
ncbi:F-box/kelch-repeat protein At3g06240-like [Papaver somniferum]|uniref:F-box/kelch-repeat protein At3g06240-like n=1 Tax=Papaver somniferum TaxID=3469 RepID=UPI000E6F51DF|nr:F-box/kelch-repeat protein At3g06240-like [Papaver somniferum]